MTVHSPAAAPLGDKRDRILDAAEQVFARHGFFSAKVAMVAKEAGVADGTIYLYFKSKDELLISLFESRMERVNERLATAVGKAHGAEAKLRAFIRAFLSMVKEQPSVAEILTVELRQSEKFMKEYSNPRFAEFLRLLAGIVQDGQAQGELAPSVPPAMAARMIFGTLNELATAWLLAKKFDIVRAADWASAMVLQGLQVRSQ